MGNSRLIAQAKQGNAIAINTLLNQSLAGQGIWARILTASPILTLALESTEAPDPEAVTRRLQAGLERLQPQGIHTVVLQGWILGDDQPTWERQIHLASGLIEFPTTLSQPAVTPHDFTPISLSPSVTPAPTLGSGTPQPRLIPTARTTRKRPLVLKWSDFDPMMLAIIGFIGIYGFFGAQNPSYGGPFIWLHYPDLAIHETGHLLFMPFGDFLILLGGSLTQIAFPAAFTAYFFYSRQFFSSALTLFWTGQNFMDVGVYMRDAPYRELPLTVDDIDAHDWWQLFNMMGCLDQAEAIANVTHAIGVLLYILSVIAGIYVAYYAKQTFYREHPTLKDS